MKAKKKQKRIAILANQSYGLYFGEVLSFDKKNKVATVANCRHVCHWQGRTGGITSLAAYGLCGPKAAKSRIGAPCSRATLSGIVNIFDCTPEAAATIEAAVVT